MLTELLFAAGGGALGPAAIGVAVILGAAAALQAWLGRRLAVRALDERWRGLESERDLGQLFLLAGPVAGLVVPTVRVAVSAALEPVAAGELAFGWVTGWIAGVLGVVVVAPVALLFLVGGDAAWRRRAATVALPTLASLAISLVAFAAAARWETHQRREVVESVGRAVTQRLDRRLVAHEEALAALSRLVEVTPEMSSAQFEHFTRETLVAGPDVFALSYDPWFLDAGREAFEAAMAARTGAPGFVVTERIDGRLGPAARRPWYVAVGYIAPIEPNRAALGFDISSEPVRRRAIESARTTGRTAITAPLRLVQAENRVGLLELHPARAVGADGRVEVLGFAVGVFLVDELVHLALRDQIPAGWVLRLVDAGAATEGEASVLYDDPRGAVPVTEPYVWATELHVADRRWSLVLYPPPGWLAAERPLIGWGVGVLGSLFTALLGVMMVGTTGRTTVIERKVREQTEDLRLAKEAAVAASLAKSRFLTMMSHEIRTPMNGILGMAQLLTMKVLNEDQRDDYVHALLTSGNTLQALLDDVLDLARIESGRLELHATPVDPQQLLDQIALLYRGSTQQKGLAFSAVWRGPADANYWVDAVRLRQMLNNLVSNAVKFTEAGSIRVEAAERARRGDRAELELSVEDTGIGISEAQLPLLFEPFTQADSSDVRRFGGAGLGLSILRQLAELMGGTVGVESEPGRGSRFWIRLLVPVTELGPRDRPHATAASPGEALEATPSAARNAGLEILLVEDHPINLKLVQILLQKRGYAVKSATNGQEALDLLLTGYAPDAVLMDCQMPIMDGYTATRRIRAWEREARRTALPIIAVTAGAFEEDRERCFAAGMDDFLPKPIEIGELDRIVAHWAIRARERTVNAPPVNAP